VSFLSRIERLEELFKPLEEFAVVHFPWEEDPQIHAKRWLREHPHAAKAQTTLIMLAQYGPATEPINQEGATNEDISIN
jgi:hypothetical protein